MLNTFYNYTVILPLQQGPAPINYLHMFRF